MLTGEVIDRLKDLADELGAFSIAVALRPDEDRVVRVEVRHAGLYDEAPDGWTIERTEMML